MKIARQTQKDILWSTFVQYAGKFVSIALGIVAVKLVTNAIGIEQYGIYGKISEYALFFSVAANMGIYGNTVRKMSDRPNDGKLFVNAFLLRLGTAAIFFLIGGLYAWLFIPEQGFALGVLFFLSSLFFDYISSVCNGMLQANYLMGRSTLAVILGRLANLGIVILLIRLGSAFAPIYFLAPLAASVVTALLTLAFVRMRIKFVWKLDRSLMRMLFLTSLPFGIINILNNLYYRFLPSFFAIKALTDTQFGSYNVSLHIATTVSLLSTYLMFSTLPAFKRDLRDKHMRSAKTLYKRIRLGLAVLAVLTIGVGSWLAPYAIGLVSNKSYFLPELWFVLPLMLTLAAVSYFYDLVLITLFALEKDMWFLKRELIALAVGGSILAASLIPGDPIIKISIVLLGAIAGESTMVILGLFKIRRELA